MVRKETIVSKASAEIVKANARYFLIRQFNSNEHQEIDYQVHLQIFN